LKNRDELKHYTELTFRENRERLRELLKFKELVETYFDNSRLNLLSGSYVEKQEASDARVAINAIMQKMYTVMRLADIKTSAAYSSSVNIGGDCQNIDLILNMFNLGRNEIPPNAVIDFIERAIDVYKSNRLHSFIRTINPLFWISALLKHIAGGDKKRV